MLPELSLTGHLLQGIYPATWEEIEVRFGRTSPRRTRAFAKLRHLHQLPVRTDNLQRFIVFGSFVCSAPNPRNVDIVLIMRAEFKLEDSPRESRTLFSHADAEARFGASVFWLREGMLPDEIMGMLLETWQTKRDGTKRGILEVITA